MYKRQQLPQSTPAAALPAATATAIPTETATPPPTATATAAATATPSPSPIATLAGAQRVPVNGVPWEAIVVMPPEVVARAKEIYAAGRALGRNPRAYSKVGDSTTENPHFMARFDTGPYNLAAYSHLQPAVDRFLGSHGRDSIAVRLSLIHI